MNLITVLPHDHPNKVDEYVNTISKIDLPEIFDSERYFHNDSDSDKQGIELLKWCRLKQINKHIILRSRDSISKLLKDSPKNAIVATKGVTLLSPHEEAPGENLEAADPDDIKEIFKLDFDLKKIKHDEANKFGIQKLFESHLKIEPECFFPSTSVGNQLISEIFRYIFSESQPYKPKLKKINRIKERLENLRDQESTIVYVDDKANEGWAYFLKIILGCICPERNISPECKCKFHTIIPKDRDDEITLSKKIKNLIDVKTGKHLLIFDLKLKPIDENKITDYRELLSYKTVALLREDDDRYRIMYLTASNDLSKFRKLLLSKKYNPHVVFTKEGADQLLSDEESFSHYVELIDLLSAYFVVDTPRKIVESIQIVNLIEENQKNELAEFYEQCCKSVSSLRKFPLYDEFDEIFFDANIVLHENPKDILELMITQADKIFIPATVKYELQYMGKGKETKEPLVAIRAAFFDRCIDELNLKIEETITPQERSIINSGQQPPKGFGDKQLIRLSENKSRNTLYLSADREVFNASINVTTKTKIMFKPGQPKNISVAQPTVPAPILSKQPQAPTNFEVKQVSISKDGNYFVFSKDLGSPIKLSLRKTDIPGISFSQLKQTIIGKTISTHSTSQEIINFLNTKDQ